MAFLLQWVGRVWASPVTIVGVLLACVCVPRFVRRREGVLHVGVRYLIPWWIGIAGQTWGDVVLTTKIADDHERLWRHEMIHVYQCHALGALVLVLYPLLLLSTALTPGARYYRDHPFECQAYILSTRR